MNTAEDYLRFSAMLSQNGVFEGRRGLSAKAVGDMLTDQTPKAQMTPTGANVLPDAHYSLGSWGETWDAEDARVRNSSIGLFGVYPWIERHTGRFGIMFPYVREGAFRF